MRGDGSRAGAGKTPEAPGEACAPQTHSHAHLLCGIREQPSGPGGSGVPLTSNKLTLCRSLHSPVHVLRNPKVHQVWSTFLHVWFVRVPSVPANLAPLLALSGFGRPCLIGPPGSLWSSLPSSHHVLALLSAPCPCSRLAQYLQGHTENIPSLLAFDALLGALQHVNMVHLSVGMLSRFSFLEDYIPCPSSQMLFPYQSILLIVPRHTFS